MKELIAKLHQYPSIGTEQFAINSRFVGLIVTIVKFAKVKQNGWV